MDTSLVDTKKLAANSGSQGAMSRSLTICTLSTEEAKEIVGDIHRIFTQASEVGVLKISFKEQDVSKHLRKGAMKHWIE